MKDVSFAEVGEGSGDSRYEILWDRATESVVELVAIWKAKRKYHFSDPEHWLLPKVMRRLKRGGKINRQEVAELVEIGDAQRCFVILWIKLFDSKTDRSSLGATINLF